jgi:hypothetical protein
LTLVSRLAGSWRDKRGFQKGGALDVHPDFSVEENRDFRAGGI